MAGAIQQFTGSEDTTQNVTLSSALSANVLTTQYNMGEDLIQVQSHINDVLRTRGTHGSTKSENFQKYLHQRQENLITYVHRDKGYGYVFIPPSDVHLVGAQTNLNFKKYPNGTVIPSGLSAYAEFLLPKDSKILTGTKPYECIDVQISASSQYILNTNYYMYRIAQHEQQSITTTDLANEKIFGDRIKIANTTFNSATGTVSTKASDVTKQTGNGGYRHLIIIPKNASYASEKIFFGARIPISMA